MANINEQTSSMADFITKLDAFLTTNGWTQDRLVTGSGEWAISKAAVSDTVRLAAQWDTGTPGNLGLYQYLGAYNIGLAPYAQADDSGNGAQSTSNATLGTARHVPLGSTPIQYWAFEEDHYFHVVVESSSGQFRHFGAGQLSKFGDWTGGTYVYGQRIAGTSTSQVGLQLVDTSLLDGIAMDGINPTTNDMELYVATLHCEGLPGQVASGKYAVHMGNQASGNLGNDRQSTPIARSHFVGGHRGGPWARVLSRFEGSDLSGHLPMYPIGSMYWRRGNSDAYGPMGVMKDVRGVSIRDYVGGQELTIGGDTWVIFPVRTKWSGSGAHTSTTDYQGIAYKKIP